MLERVCVIMYVEAFGCAATAQTATLLVANCVVASVCDHIAVACCVAPVCWFHSRRGGLCLIKQPVCIKANAGARDEQ